MATANEIAKRLLEQGKASAINQTNPDDLTGWMWDEYGFNAQSKTEWTQGAGVWCPYVAAVCRDAGVTPQQVRMAVCEGFIGRVCRGERHAMDLVEASR